jgi:uncharacterized SAM-binding protein YcdF (DUF218 family)
MFFVASKIFYFLLIPLNWILFLLAASLLINRNQWKRKFRYTSLFIAIIFSNPLLHNSISRWWEPPLTKLPPNAQYSVGILLGGLSMYDAKFNGYFGNNADRFIQTINLYHSGEVKQILISGGQNNVFSKEPTEASFLYSQLIRNGVPKEAIIVESKSRNTYENAIYSKEILDSLHLKPPYVVVTSAQHMPRAMMVFKKAGYANVIPYPCNYHLLDRPIQLFSSILPDITLLGNWQYLLKELLGVVAYKITGKA